MKNSIYKRFLRNLAVYLVILVVIYAILFSLQFGPYITTEYWIRDAYIIKQHIARSIKEKKIIIIGGSNGLFGFDSSLIEKTTGIKTANMCIFAGLSMDFILDPGKLYLNQGDIVILPLEFECYRQEKPFNDRTIEAIIAWDKEYFNHLSPWKKIEFIASCSPLRVVGALFNKYITGRKRETQSPAKVIAAAQTRWAKNDKNVNRSVYLNISPYGDIIGNRGSKKDIKLVGYGLNNSGWEVTSYSKKSMASFLRYCRERGVEVFFTWPCTLKSKHFNINSKIIRNNLAKIEDFFSEIDAPVLGKPEDFHFERKFFYDTAYHLNYAGREVRTRRLLEFFVYFCVFRGQ